jgi:hypothetical protein
VNFLHEKILENFFEHHHGMLFKKDGLGREEGGNREEGHFTSTAFLTCYSKPLDFRFSQNRFINQLGFHILRNRLS